MKIFPIELRCDRDKGWSNQAFYQLFRDSKPPKSPYYGYDVIITSPTTCTFITYDLEYDCGGNAHVGRKLQEWWSDCDRELTQKFIDMRCHRLATEMRENELYGQELLIIETYAMQIKKEAGL